MTVQLLLHPLLTLAFVYVVGESSLLRPLRHAFVVNSPRITAPLIIGLLYCPRCLGFWMGILAARVVGLHFAFALNAWHDALLAGFIGLAAMHLFYGTFLRQQLDPWLEAEK